MNSLIQKYNIPGPRYTSYPTVPYWDNETFSKEKWIETFKRSFIESNSSEGISLYIHLPFCESLCTFCACHKHITKRHEMEDPYIETVLKEWQLYVDLVDEMRKNMVFFQIFSCFNFRHAEIVDQIRLPGMCVCFGWDKDGDLLAAITDKSSNLLIWDANTRRSQWLDSGTFSIDCRGVISG